MLLSWHWLPSNGVIFLVGIDQRYDTLQTHGNFSMSLYRSFAFLSFWPYKHIADFYLQPVAEWSLNPDQSKMWNVWLQTLQWLQRTFATETWEVFWQDAAKLSGAARERLLQLISIFLLDALLDVVHAVWGSFANVAPGSGEKERRRVRRPARVAPKITRSQLCRCSAELLTPDGASLAKTFQSGVLKMTITPYNSYCDVSRFSRGCINYGGTLAPRQRRCYRERKRRPQIRACSEPERRYYPSAFLFFMFVFKV